MPPTLRSIAIADDEPGIRNLLQRAILDLGYSISGTAQTGEEALTLVQKTRPQLLLLDLHMPAIDGLEVAQQLLPLGTTAIVILTGDADPALARKALDMGVSGYMLKPFEVSQIGPIMETAWHRF